MYRATVVELNWKRKNEGTDEGQKKKNLNREVRSWVWPWRSGKETTRELGKQIKHIWRPTSSDYPELPNRGRFWGSWEKLVQQNEGDRERESSTIKWWNEERKARRRNPTQMKRNLRPSKILGGLHREGWSDLLAAKLDASNWMPRAGWGKQQETATSN
jgi:hypothetical protein